VPRPRVPVEQRLIEGTYKPSRHGPLPVVNGDGGAPVKPKHVKGEAAKVWKNLLTLLAERVQQSDGGMLGELCIWWARLNTINASLDELEPGSAEFGRALIQAGIATDKVSKMAQQFGLTPADRAKLGVVSTGPPVAKVPSKSKSPV
jgi:phage terminase small subunit